MVVRLRVGKKFVAANMNGNTTQGNSPEKARAKTICD
jgi:hypothetical protein